MNKLPVYLFQVNNRYGDNVFLPYSVGLLQAYGQTIGEVAKHFEFKEPGFLREDPARVTARLDRPRVVGMSCYIWNWEYSLLLAQTIKARYPDCLMVLGGPQVPLHSERFFEDHPSVDLLVHYEGELPFADILLESLNASPDYTRIPGLSVRVEGSRSQKTAERPRNLDLSTIPSPYLTGVFDDVMRQPYAFHASQETHRGCPYSCTFCDWGSATMNRVRAFDDRRLHEEFEWFGRQKIDLLYNCDANYGLLPRDMALTHRLVETKAKHGFPRKFRAAYAKNSNLKVFEIARLLNQAEMCKGITLSFQSMDTHTLQVIQRANIKITDFEQLMRQYRSEGIPTYTELILGLPGESYESFAEGLHTLLAAGGHDSLNVYTCTVLPNAEMADPAYRAAHGIRTVRAPILLTHCTPREDPVTEYHEMVVETAAMPRADWRRAYLLSWAVQCFHCLGLTQHLAVWLFTEFGFSYRRFYEALLGFAQRHPSSLTGRQHRLVSDIVARILQGGTWDLVIPKFGNVVWPPEEGTFLNLVAEKGAFYAEMRRFVEELSEEKGLGLAPELLDDLFTYQAHLIIDPVCPKKTVITLQHDFHAYFQHAYLGKRMPLSKRPVAVEIQADAVYGGDLEAYAKHVVWYGRKGGRFRHSNVTVRALASISESVCRASVRA